VKKTKTIILMALIFAIGFSPNALTNAMHGYFNGHPIVQVDVNGRLFEGEAPLYTSMDIRTFRA
jgi:hypothetical protein